VRVTIPRFSLSHDTFQSADSPKYLVFSTRQFELWPDRPATFAVDLAVENIGGDPGDYRRGMAAYHVFDLEISSRVFAVCGSSTRVLALHEQLGLGGGGAGEPFYRVVESPYEDFDDDFTPLRACEITLDRSRSTAAWRVDGRAVYEAHGTLIPERARIGSGSGRCSRSGTGAVARSTGRAWTRGGTGSVFAESTPERGTRAVSLPLI
jgi:hypothetical protein